MSRLHTALLLCLSLATPAATVIAQPPATFSGYESLIARGFLATISGDLVVFTHREFSNNIYYVDLSAGTRHPVAVDFGDQLLGDASNGRIVYTDERTWDVMLFDIASGTTTNLTFADKAAIGADIRSLKPAIDGNLVVWVDYREEPPTPPGIYAMDLSTSEVRRIGPGYTRPDVSGSVIVWEYNLEVWSYDWTTRLTTRVTDSPSCWGGMPRIDGRRIVYYGSCAPDDLNGDLFAYDLQTAATRRLTLDGFAVPTGDQRRQCRLRGVLGRKTGPAVAHSDEPRCLR